MQIFAYKESGLFIKELGWENLLVIFCFNNTVKNTSKKLGGIQTLFSCSKAVRVSGGPAGLGWAWVQPCSLLILEHRLRNNSYMGLLFSWQKAEAR